MLTLRFYALGTMSLAAANLVGVSKSSTCVIVKKISIALASLRPIYIKFPQTPEEIKQIRTEFYIIAKFPHVIGKFSGLYSHQNTIIW